MRPLFFDATVDPMVTQKTPEGGKDILQASANNVYRGVSMADLKEWVGERAQAGRAVPKGFPRSNRFGPAF